MGPGGGGRKGRQLKLFNPKNEDIECQFNSLNFIAYFAEMSSYFSMKPNKRKIRKCLKYVKEF